MLAEKTEDSATTAGTTANHQPLTSVYGSDGKLITIDDLILHRAVSFLLAMGLAR